MSLWKHKKKKITLESGADLSASGWVSNVEYMGVSGWTQTEYGTLVPPPGVSMCASTNSYIDFEPYPYRKSNLSFSEPHKVKCKHCGQYGEARNECKHCGAPVDPEE
jgi:hypothetical protein